MLSAQKYGENLHVNYSPFGAILYGRNWSSEKYRYGFNGMEKDDEVAGEGNSQDYGFRIYSQRLGRFLSVDPLFAEYPMLTPYQFADNRPIKAIDLDGLEAWDVPNDAKNVFSLESYQEFARTMLETLTSEENQLKFDCADLVLLTYPNSK